MTAPITVRGGVGGIEARVDDLDRLAAVLRGVAGRLGQVTVRVEAGAAVLAAPATAVVDPAGAADAAAAVVAAGVGSGGTAPLAARSAALAAAVGAAALGYRTVDSLRTDAVVHALGDLARVPIGVGAAAGVLLRTRRPTVAAQAGLGADAGAVADLAEAVGLGHPERVAARIGRAFPDGRPALEVRGGDPTGDAALPAPRSVRDLVIGLARRDDDVPGAIDVRTVTTVDADGTVHRRAIVDVPGCKDWTGATHDTDVANIGSDLRSLGGAPTTYAAGVLAALAAAGVTPDDDVLFVGHSLGGMVAVTAAGMAAARGYRVGGVVTAGSPLGRIAPPPGVAVLALENVTDVVPQFDGVPNPAGPDEVTVTVRHPIAGTSASHDLRGAYAPGAADVDASTDPSVVRVRERLAPFLRGGAVHTQVFTVSRVLP